MKLEFKYGITSIGEQRRITMASVFHGDDRIALREVSE
jgi:hypothetical protein